MVHTGGGRRRGKARPRILYWFRTPPGVRIGRSALDESAIRLIEEHNPDVEFDWTRILKGQESPIETGGQPQDRRGRPRRDFPPRTGSQPFSTGAQGSRQSVHRVSEAVPVTEPLVTQSIDSEERDVAEVKPVPAHAEFLEPDASECVAVLDAGLTPVGADGVGELFDGMSSRSTAGPEGETTTAAQARLGSEGLSRLRARHAEVLARISEIVTEPVRRDELKSRADRLNPDTWVTDAEVTEGLESYETVFESLRSVIGRRNKRRRRSGRRLPATESSGAADSGPSISGEEATDPEDVGEDL